MVSFRALLLRHGYSFLFLYVLGVQVGVPVPADPLLLFMGAMVGDRHFGLGAAFLAAASGALLGDLFWYELGRHRGRSVLRLLCKLSLEPDTCIRKTESAFTKRGAGVLLLAKFVPGMSLVSMPLAGVIRMPRRRFLLADAAGCSIWAVAYLVAGDLLHRQVDSLIHSMGLVGRRAGLGTLLLIGLYVAYRLFQRWRLRRELRINRITPEAVLKLMQGPHPFTIVDLRHSSDIEQEGLKIAGAIILRPGDLRSRSREIPPGQEIILYCT
ncbi:MAG TPA: VTT domain-containing protein [Bryobacteraceae bacterium]|nr:VTT domain-containing protein [Bryobacteraceae bacterium]